MVPPAQHRDRALPLPDAPLPQHEGVCGHQEVTRRSWCLPRVSTGTLNRCPPQEQGGQSKQSPCSKQPGSLGEGNGQGTRAPHALGHLLSFLGVQVAEGDGVERVVPSEEQPETQGRDVMASEPPTPAHHRRPSCPLGIRGLLHDQAHATPGMSFTSTLPAGRAHPTCARALGTWGDVGGGSYFLWLSVKVMPCAETLKWTIVAVGVGSATSVSATALEMAWGPVSDSISTELMKSTLQAGGGEAGVGSATAPGCIRLTAASLYSPAPCLRRSVAELVADAASFFSSMGSRRDGTLLLLPAWKPARRWAQMHYPLSSC